MGIWDDITNGAKNAAAFTAKKAGELTNIAKLKFSLHTEESNLNKCFEELGSLYYDYQRNSVDHTDEINALLGEIDELNEKIDCLIETLAKSQKRSICPGCGAQVTTDYDFCPLCGAKLREDETAEKSDGSDDSDAGNETKGE